MGLRYRLRIQRAGQDLGAAQGEFSEEATSRLRHYTAEADRLFACSLLKDGHYQVLSFSVSTDTGWKITLPPAESVESFLHRLRPFLLQEERAHFLTVWNIISREINQDLIRKKLGTWRDRFLGKQIRSLMQLHVNGLDITSDHALFLWLNAFEYHRDADKQAVLESANNAIPFEACKAMFLELLLEKASAISSIHQFILDIERSPANNEPRP